MQQPVMRFCPTCGTDVEDVGGFCMLGHSLKVSAPTADLNTLKAEVDAAFEEAKLEVAAALGRLAPGAATPTIPDVVRLDPGRTPATNGPPTTNGAPAPAPTPAQILTDLNGAQPQPTQVRAQQPAAREITVPPPPPAKAVPAPTTTPFPAVGQPQIVGANDPITAFAPPPHMDWGPQKGRFRRRK